MREITSAMQDMKTSLPAVEKLVIIGSGPAGLTAAIYAVDPVLIPFRLSRGKNQVASLWGPRMLKIGRAR